MATPRKVTVFNMGTNASKSLISGAGTWGDLRTNEEVRSMLADDMKIVIKQTKAVIETDGAILPDGEVTIYLTPGKVKSGAKRSYRTSIRERVTPVMEKALSLMKEDLTDLINIVNTSKSANLGKK